MKHLADNPALWIALAAALLVILAHVALFWWFLCRRTSEKNHGESDTRDD